MATKTLEAISLLLTVYVYGDPDAELCAPDVPGKEWLLAEGLIHLDRERGYMVTDRGTAFAEAIRELPLPIQVWRMP